MATLKSLVDETTNIKNELKTCHSNLKNALIKKQYNITNEKFPQLISIVDEIEPRLPDISLYKAGDTSSNGKLDRVTTTGTLTYNSDHLYLYTSSSSSTKPSNFIVATKDSIDITDYSDLFINLSCGMDTNTWLYVGLIKDKSTSPSKGDVVLTRSPNINSSHKNTAGEFKLDISNLTGKYYVGILLDAINRGIGTIIYDIYLSQ